MYGIFAWAAVRSFGTVFRRSDGPGRILVGAFWAAAAGHLVHLVFGVPVTGNTFLLWVALGVVLAPTARIVEVKGLANRKWATGAAAAVAVVAALGIGYQFVPLAADHAHLTALVTTDPGRLKAAESAVRLNPLKGSYRTQLAMAHANELETYLDAAKEAEAAGKDPSRYEAAAKSSFESAKTAFEDAGAFQPDEIDNYVPLAALYARAGQALDKGYYQKAIEVARGALALDPNGTPVRTVLALGLLGTGQVEEAAKELEYCVKVEPGGARAALLLARIYESQGRAAEALEVLKRVERWSPGQDGVAQAIEELEAKSDSEP